MKSSERMKFGKLGCFGIYSKTLDMSTTDTTPLVPSFDHEDEHR